LVEIDAAKIFLAAGALGNSAILLRSGFRKSLPALGTRFTCHPQYMTYAIFDEPIDAHKGAFQAVKSNDKKFRVSGLKFENVFAPPIGTAMLLPGIGRTHHRLMKKYRYMASMEVAIRDDATGKISVSKNGKILIDKKMTAEDRNKSKEGLEHVKKCFLVAGAKEENIFACHQGFGLHLMGGCPIGSDSAAAVVDPDFRVFGSKNIYIADSSIFPAAPGINPSFSIMALSRMAAMKAVAP
ncbi:MAG: GMC family oxidoreductase, partial [Bdellovibrionota bacterium]